MVSQKRKVGYNLVVKCEMGAKMDAVYDNENT